MQSTRNSKIATVIMSLCCYTLLGASAASTINISPPQTVGDIGSNSLGVLGWIIAVLSITSIDRKSTRLNSSHITRSRMPSSA